MDDKPKIIIKLQRLYLILSGLFFVDSILLLFFIINNIFLFFSDPGPEIGIFTVCLLMYFIGFIFCLTMSIFTFNLWRAIKKGIKPIITKGLVVSIISLLILIGPTILILWNFIDVFHMYWNWRGLPLFLFIAFLLLTIILNIIITVTSLTRQVSAYCMASADNK